jgi:hypothetical protein
VLAVAGVLAVVGVVVACALAALPVLAVSLEPQPLARTARATGRNMVKRRGLRMREF